MTILFFSEFRLCGSQTMKRRRNGFLSACVVSWCATAYHVSAALEGFSRTSAMSLYALRALPTPTVFRCDRFLIRMFPCAVLLLCTHRCVPFLSATQTVCTVTILSGTIKCSRCNSGKLKSTNKLFLIKKKKKKIQPKNCCSQVLYI